MREQLGATADEWTKVLKPRLDKVQQLQRQMRGGFRGRRRPRAEGAAEAELSDVEKKTEALRKLLDDKASGAAAIKTALGALRKAREKTQKELEAARKKLQGVVTMRQEAQLVLMGVLD